MRFIFKPRDAQDQNNLCQGDVIRRTPELAEAICQAHDYYGRAEDYSHFVVLTQSCDLVRRRGQVKAPYLTLTAARPMRVVVDKFISQHVSQVEGSNLRIIKNSAKRRLEEKLERLIHNTDDGLFFLPQDGCEEIPEDLCAFLHLSIALRTDHYETILRAKVAEIDDVFRAKLGWLAGNIYSRVATPDIEEHIDDPKSYKKDFYNKHSRSDEFLWLSPFQLDLLKRQIREHLSTTKQEELPRDDAELLISEIPTDAEIISNSIVEKLVRNGIIEEDAAKIKKARNIIVNTQHFKQLINQLRD